MEPVACWFLIGGVVVLLPLLLAAALLLRQENIPRERLWQERMRFRCMTGRDWTWALGGLLVIWLSSGALMVVLKVFFGQQDLQPAFLVFEPLGPGRYWILAAWLPFVALNIMGEEILWHGVLLPRQESAFGRHAWLVNGIGWLLFHLPFGWQIVITLCPTVFIIPFAVQRRQNSWIGVVMHAGLNGPGFLIVAFGPL
jgi:membrane protease YdiL (CAAX protease family)